MRNLCFLLLGLCLINFPAYAALDLSEIGVGARPLGMGKAYVALADDASAIFSNPAGLGRNKNLNVTSMGGTMLGDVSYLVLGASDQSPLGKFGVGYIYASTGGIPLTAITGSGSSAAVSVEGFTDYNSSVILFSYGSRLSRFLKGGVGNNFSLGVNLKYFLQGFTGGGTTMQDAVGVGMDADLGFQWDVNYWATLGLVFQNFLPKSFGGRFIWQKNSITEDIPLVIRGGGHFRILGPSALRGSEDQSLDLLVDYENNSCQNRPSVWHIGVEYWPMDMIALRVGIDQKPKATELGVGVDSNLTAGVGVFLGGFTFDYAYHQFGDLTENTTHFFSIGYRGEEKVRERMRKVAEKKKSGVPLPEIVPKPQLKTFTDVPEDYWAKKPIEYLATLGIMDGYPDGTFKPTHNLTRGELANILAKVKGISTAEVIAKYMGGKAILPDQKVTRAEAAQILARFSGLYQKPKVSKRPFPDLPVDHWASPAVAATKEVGLFAYLAGKGFGPDLSLTRAEAAEIISKIPLVKKKIEKLISGEKE